MQSELDDHLLAINENTNELHANYEQLCQLENRLEKLTQKVEGHEIAWSQQRPVHVHQRVTLCAGEKRVFLALYTAQSLTFAELSSVLALPLIAVRQYVASLVQKGVPVVADDNAHMPRISLPHAFKQLQAKDNLVDLSEQLPQIA